MATLYVVATPLGNLGDITRRAADVLGAVELVAAEDTRRTAHLLQFLGVSKPQVSCHKFNEAAALTPLLDALAAGRSIALVTDGGTPAISDPGFRLVAAAHAAGHRVEPIPGPSAVVAALSVAGLPADRFHFAGFLPAKSAARRTELQRLAAFEETLVVYEAPHRLAEFLADALLVLGDRPATLCRELTKLHEEVRSSTLGALKEAIDARAQVLGEIVLVIAGRSPDAPPALGTPDPELADAWRAALVREDGDERRALRHLARERGMDRAALRRQLQAAGVL